MHVTDGDLSPLLIHSLQWNYEVQFAPTVTGALVPVLDPSLDVFAICDENVASLYAAQLAPLLDSRPSYIVPATEETKSLAGVAALVDWLMANRAVRSSILVAIGGGCIQDLVSFTAHLYYRGIAWIFLPTTVLSQSDSCIGAKSGINVLPYKNQLGVLHSPRRIMISTEFVGTLPDVEVASGYGEIVKLAVTSSRHFLPLLESALANGGIRNPRLLDLTRASLAAKQEIIEEDEYEADLRRILNYGHSFGHALEAITGHKVPHGLGVLWGIEVINWLGVRWGVTSPRLADRLSVLIRANFGYTLPVTPTADALIGMLSRDKKVANGKMHFAVLVDEGSFLMLAKELGDELRDLVTEFLGTDYVFRRD